VASFTSLIALQRVTPTLRTVVSGGSGPTLKLPFQSEHMRQAEPARLPALPPRPRPESAGGGRGGAWEVVGASWGVAALVILSLIVFRRRFRLRRER
jgi:hypothetical protein